MTANQAALVWCPFSDPESARSIAKILLEEKLIACANILPRIESVFEWQGKTSSEVETAILLKTSADLLDKLIKRLGECHPYDTPAIVGWRCDAAHPQTLEWLAGIVTEGPN